MTIPHELRLAAEEALKSIEADENHEFRPIQRVALLNVFDSLNTEMALLARQWLAILSVYRVLRLYEPSIYLHPRETNTWTPDEFAANLEVVRYYRADEALALAIRVVRGNFKVEAARDIADNLYIQGDGELTIPLRCYFIEQAAYSALVTACSSSSGYYVPPPTFQRTINGQLVSIPWEQLSDIIWVIDKHADAGGEAAVAWAMDTSEVDGKNIANAWNWWTNHPKIDSRRLLEYWQWWLLEAIPAAWRTAEQFDAQS